MTKKTSSKPKGMKRPRMRVQSLKTHLCRCVFIIITMFLIFLQGALCEFCSFGMEYISSVDLRRMYKLIEDKTGLFNIEMVTSEKPSLTTLFGLKKGCLYLKVVSISRSFFYTLNVIAGIT